VVCGVFTFTVITDHRLNVTVSFQPTYNLSCKLPASSNSNSNSNLNLYLYSILVLNLNIYYYYYSVSYYVYVIRYHTSAISYRGRQMADENMSAIPIP